MPHDKFQKLKTRLNDKKKVDGQSKTIGEILDGGHDVLRAIYINKVLDNDPLAQTLYEIQNHEPPLREKAYEELVDDSLIVFAKDSLEAIIKQTIKKL